MLIKLTYGGDFSRFRCGICEPGVTISVPERDGLQLIECGAATAATTPSQKPVSITLSIKGGPTYGHS